MRVLIIGGGIGGLCLAHGLREAGIDVAVYERTAAGADWLQGYRIHLNPDGCRALHDCLDGLDGIVRHGREFIGYERIAGGRTRVHFADGSSADADLLIGADGSNSRVRGQYLPELSRLDTGVFNVAGRYPLSAEAAARLPGELTHGSGYVLTPRSDAMFVSAWRAPEPPSDGIDGAGIDGAGIDGADGIDAEDYVLWAYAAARSSFPADVERWDPS